MKKTHRKYVVYLLSALILVLSGTWGRVLYISYFGHYHARSRGIKAIQNEDTTFFTARLGLTINQVDNNKYYLYVETTNNEAIYSKWSYYLIYNEAKKKWYELKKPISYLRDRIASDPPEHIFKNPNYKEFNKSLVEPWIVEESSEFMDYVIIRFSKNPKEIEKCITKLGFTEIKI